jgi:hypothetical protein
MSLEFQVQNFRVLHPTRSCGQSIRSVGIVVGGQIATDREGLAVGIVVNGLYNSSAPHRRHFLAPCHLFFAPSRPAAIVAAPCLSLFLFSLSMA